MKGHRDFIAAACAAGLFACLLTVAAAAPAVPAADKKPAAGQQPVRISADAAEYHSRLDMVVFIGSVVASQADSTLTADRMELLFTAEPQGAGAPAGTAEKPVGVLAEQSGGRQLKTITALKNVKLRQVDAETKKERYATSDKAVYDAQRREVTMTGSPRLWEGRNVIAGEEMVFSTEGQDVVVRGKVNLTVFPDDLGREARP